MAEISKGKAVVHILLGRILIPLSLLAAAVLRQNIISLVYFILLLISPVIPRNKHAFTGPFYGYIVAVLVYSCLVVVAQAIFHLYLGLYAVAHQEHYGDVLVASTNSCQLTDVLQLIGFQRVDAPPAEAYQSVRLLLPDGVLLLFAIITFKVLKHLTNSADLPTTQPANPTEANNSGVVKKYVETFGEVTIFLLLGVSGAMLPSAISAFYFLVFFGILLCWSLHFAFKTTPYALLKMVVFAYLISHMLLLYLCQLNFLSSWLTVPENMFYNRLLGMTPLFSTSCSEPWSVSILPHSWTYFANPIALFCTFIALSLDIAYHRSKMDAGSSLRSPIGRSESLRSSENQLLTVDRQPNYESVVTNEGLQSEPQEDGENNADETDLGNSQQVRKVWVTIYNFVLRNSYLLAFCAMLFWSVIYPSWTAFVFLILGCMLWVFPNSRKASLICSPLLVIYAVSLTILQYVCAINFGGKDYNTSLFFNVSDNFIIPSIGLTKNTYPAVAIMMKILFTMSFCVVLRELRRENCLRGERNEEGLCLSPINGSSVSSPDDEGTPRMNRAHSVDNANLQIIGNKIVEWFSKYWIIGFYILLLLMAIQEPYIYRLIYMIFFLFSAITFQLNYEFWRRTLKGFLVTVAIYSILAMLIIYIFSFHNVLISFQNATGLEDKWLEDMGFNPNINYQEDLDGSLELLVRLIVPALLLIAVMLQLHIFQKRFMEVTHPNYLTAVMHSQSEFEGQPQDSEYGGFVGDIVGLYYRIRPHFRSMFYSTCRLMTIHMYKGIYIGVGWIVTREASALSLMLLVIVNLSLFFDPVSKLNKICLLSAQFWIGIIILARMLFQLETVPKSLLMKNCTDVVGNMTVPSTDEHFQGVQDSFKWLGLRTLPVNTGEYTDSLPYYIGGYVAVLGALMVLALFKLHDHYCYKGGNMPVGVTFPGIKKKHLDSSFIELIGYLINYGFIRFGLEICTVVSVIVVSYRQDVIGCFYILVLGILLLLNMYRRRYVRRVWFIYLIVLALLLPAQYFSALGLPTTLCHDYPWAGPLLNDYFRLWLFLPDYQRPPNVNILLADCIQLLFVALQWRVFIMESTEDHPTIIAAGDNEELGRRPPDAFQDIHDFIDNKRNVVDVIMSGVFVYSFWLCICILFITGTQNINLYCFGYLIFCFYFFWYGLDFTIKERKSVMRTWNALVYYNFIVILLKTVLQLVGCVYMDEVVPPGSSSTGVYQCYLPELFSIKCLNPSFPSTNSLETCGVSQKEAGLTWDIVCFTLLLVQRRIFMSTYFLVVICEERAQSTLASRGAELINLMSNRRIAKEQQLREKELMHISRKLERIRLRTLRLEGGLSREEWTHFNVIRSADETMFEDQSEDETTTWDSEDTIMDLSITSSKEKVNPMKMLVATIDLGMEASLKQAEKGKQGAKPQAAAENVDNGEAAAPAPDSPGPSAAYEELPGDPGDTSPERAGSPTSETLDKVTEHVKTTDVWIKVFVVSCTKWIINKLNEISFDYRTVAKQIDEEQTTVKKEIRNKMMNTDDGADLQVDISQSDINIERCEEMWQEDLEKKSLVYRLLNALYLALVARTEFICYFMMILCHLCNGNLFSLPFPIVAVLWGMLSLPRPAKTFWIFVLSYVMAVVVIKYVFQFGLWPWSQTPPSRWNDPRILVGILEPLPVTCTTQYDESLCAEDKAAQGGTYYATYELLIMISVFVHRTVLKRYGLWKNEVEQEADFDTAAKRSDKTLEEPQLPSLSAAADSVEESDENANGQPSNNSTKKSSSALVNWYRNIINGKYALKGDYYSLMVFCDFINFLISVFAYNSFGPPQSGTVQYLLQNNKVPVSFLIILLVQFAFIVIDRALYLKRSILGKLIFHVLLVVLINVYMFILLPMLTNTPFIQNPAAQLFYFIKFLYFGLSAWQIKSGYPMGHTGNFLTTKYSYVNLVLFQAFIICPFLLELRCVMDWMWTKTSLTIGSWFLMEDMFNKLFTIKCLRQGEKDFPAPRGINRPAIVKYGLGGFILLALIFIIWFPLVIFSFANTIYLLNPPVQCQMTVSIGGFQDIFTVRSQPSGIANVTVNDLSNLRNSLVNNSLAIGFLESYEATDIRTIELNGASTAIWGITEPSQADLVKVLASNDSLAVTVTLSFTRSPKLGLTAGTISAEFYFDLIPGSDSRQNLHNAIASQGGEPIYLSYFLPQYLHLPATGQPTAVDSIQCNPCDSQYQTLGMKPLSGIGLELKLTRTEYWSVEELSNCTLSFVSSCSENITNSSTLFFSTFNDRVAPDAVAFITGPGIIGLYIGMVFVIGQFVRTLTSGGSYTVMFDQLPNVDRIMRIAKDLYFVRENGHLMLEEELFAKLIYIYRSPKMLIKLSKLKTS